MTEEMATPVMQTNQMKNLMPKGYKGHDKDRSTATYISGLWLNEAGQLVISFDDTKGQNHYIGKSRVEKAMKNIPFEQVEVKDGAVTRPGLAVPAAFVERATAALATVPALEQPDEIGRLLLDTVAAAVTTANDIAAKEKLSANLAAAAAEKKAAVKVEVPAATLAEAAKGKGEAAQA